jgi:hypothetical protein
MSEELRPGWCEHQPNTPPEPQRCFRVRETDVQKSRVRGAKRGNASRFALKNLPPIDPDDPLW